jgi:hypothetical protein
MQDFTILCEKYGISGRLLGFEQRIVGVNVPPAVARCFDTDKTKTGTLVEIYL